MAIVKKYEIVVILEIWNYLTDVFFVDFSLDRSSISLSLKFSKWALLPFVGVERVQISAGV